MVVNVKIQDQFKVVGFLFKKVSLVVNCGDLVCEGQFIVDELMDYFGYKGLVKCLWFQEMNILVICKGFLSMWDNCEYWKFYVCVLVCLCVDWIMGMNFMWGYMMVWQLKGNEGIFYIGWVQMLMLCLIVVCDFEIENFKLQDFYVLKVEIKYQNGMFEVMWLFLKDVDYLDDFGCILDWKIVEGVLV